MKRRSFYPLAALVPLLLSPLALAQVPVNISYPITGGSYSNYFTSKFDVNCGGGEYSVKWGFDSTTLGSGRYYDHVSAQFGYKLPAGWHIFWVRTSCGEDRVQFLVS